MQMAPPSSPVSVRLHPATRGFSLLELLTVLAVLGVLAVSAAPSFASLTRAHRVEALKNQFIGSLHFARMEALRLGQPVVFRRLEPCGEAVLGAGDWRCGWRLFADANGNGSLDKDETVLQESALPAQTVLRKAGVVNPGSIALDRYGQVTQAGTRMELFPAGNGFSAADGVLVCLPAGSRVRTVKGATQC